MQGCSLVQAEAGAVEVGVGVAVGASVAVDGDGDGDAVDEAGGDEDDGEDVGDGGAVDASQASGAVEKPADEDGRPLAPEAVEELAHRVTARVRVERA